MLEMLRRTLRPHDAVGGRGWLRERARRPSAAPEVRDAGLSVRGCSGGGWMERWGATLLRRLPFSRLERDDGATPEGAALVLPRGKVQPRSMGGGDDVACQACE